jgi:hypothetical protein
MALVPKISAPVNKSTENKTTEQLNQVMRDSLMTQDPIKLYGLIEKMIEMVRFEQAQAAFKVMRAETQAAKLEVQVVNLMAANENLEKTLWGKK